MTDVDRRGVLSDRCTVCGEVDPALNGLQLEWWECYRCRLRDPHRADRRRIGRELITALAAGDGAAAMHAMEECLRLPLFGRREPNPPAAAAGRSGGTTGTEAKKGTRAMEENQNQEPQQSKPLGTQAQEPAQPEPQSTLVSQAQIEWESRRPVEHLPRYQSHKVVRAAKIVGMSQHGDPATGTPVQRVVLTLELERGTLLDYDVEPKWLDRAVLSANGQDLIGGYLVHYRDDYESWSPAAAFESGYRPFVQEQADTPVPSSSPAEQPPGRAITTHEVNEANRQLLITALDAPGAGGASHLYDIRGFNSSSNPSCPFKARYGEPARHSTVLFQNGPIKEVGVNGVTNEALLAIVADRLAAFQAGVHGCGENAIALTCLQKCIDYLNARTLRRERAGTEGTHKGN